MRNKALVYVEINDNRVEKVSKEIVAHVKKHFTDTELCAVLVADDQTIQTIIPDIKDLGLDKIYIIQNILLKHYNVSVYSSVLSQLISNINPDVFLMGATCDGRELAPRIASKLNIGLTADCTDLQLDIDGNLLATRPTYGGKMMATIISKTKPNFATVRQGAFKFSQQQFLEPEIMFFDADYCGLDNLINQIEILKTHKKGHVQDWAEADIIVAGGAGLKSKDNFELMYKLAELIGGKPAASRAAIELGWAPQNLQVGQTGKSISPKLYIAFGISGALQHMTGVSNAQKIIAVNIDKNAPIMSIADIAIPADAIEVINALISKLSN